MCNLILNTKSLDAAGLAFPTMHTVRTPDVRITAQAVHKNSKKMMMFFTEYSVL